MKWTIVQQNTLNISNMVGSVFFLKLSPCSFILRTEDSSKTAFVDTQSLTL